MSYNNILSFGDFIPLKITCDVSKLFNEIKEYKFSKYNPRTSIERYGLSITSLDGELGGIDLDSFKQYNEEHNTNYTERQFNKFTKVYEDSPEIQKLVKPFKKHIYRSHILYIPKGGYFPPHRDIPQYVKNQPSFRVLIPLKNCNPHKLYFVYEDKILNFEHGRAYFLNTNKSHTLFSYGDSYMVVLNVDCNDETKEILCQSFQVI